MDQFVESLAAIAGVLLLLDLAIFLVILSCGLVYAMIAGVIDLL